MLQKLIKAEALEIDAHQYEVRYFELRTTRGGRRYSAEVLLGSGDRIILDDDTVLDLETRAAHLMPASLHSRRLARRPTAA
jgi:hypothetical protein